MGKKLSHIDSRNQPAMVDISEKSPSRRVAHAQARLRLPAAVQSVLEDGEIRGPKGPVFQTAIIAGTQAAKKTHELIPFCHPLGLDSCRIEITDQADELVIDCRVKVTHTTGVEMEALTGASVAALTVYDMCKALSHKIVIRELRLVSKSGGKSDYQAEQSL